MSEIIDSSSHSYNSNELNKCVFINTNNPKVKSQDVTPRNLASGADDAFIWQHGLMTDLGTLGGSSSLAVAINERAHVVGVSETSSGQSHAFLWQNAVMTDLEAQDIAEDVPDEQSELT